MLWEDGGPRRTPSPASVAPHSTPARPCCASLLPLPIHLLSWGCGCWETVAWSPLLFPGQRAHTTWSGRANSQKNGLLKSTGSHVPPGSSPQAGRHQTIQQGQHLLAARVAKRVFQRRLLAGLGRHLHPLDGSCSTSGDMPTFCHHT